MLKDWLLTGCSYESLAVKYKVSYSTVATMSAKNDWKGLRQKAMERSFAAAVNEVKGMTLTLTHALKRDMQRVAERAMSENKDLTKEERDHFRALLDRFFKESRLDEGKPTDIQGGNGNQSVNIILPPGVKRFGLIPPAAQVQVVESTSANAPKQVTLEDAGVDPKDVK
jgi:hypothetical protein